MIRLNRIIWPSDRATSKSMRTTLFDHCVNLKSLFECKYIEVFVIPPLYYIWSRYGLRSIRAVLYESGPG